MHPTGILSCFFSEILSFQVFRIYREEGLSIEGQLPAFQPGGGHVW